MAAPRDASTGKTDVEIQLALLGVYRHLELDEQLREILGVASKWAAPALAFVFSPGDEGRMIPLDASIPGSDPRYRQVRPLRAESVNRHLPRELNVFPGLGTFSGLDEEWSGLDAVESWVLRVTDTENELAGLLWLIFDRAPEGSSRDWLQQFLVEARAAVHNSVQVRAMRDLVIKDDTASCYNRRFFEEFLPEELARASRFRSPVSLIFFDLDNLKQVNNQYGHAMGSRTLFEISLRVRGKIRKFDKLFRFGGDEFCIVLPETDWHGALEVAERVRESIIHTPFLAEYVADGNGVAVTASFGVASFPLHARTKEDLVLQADRAMQGIKNRSKNAVGVATAAGEKDG